LVEIFDQKIETRGGKYKNPWVFTEEIYFEGQIYDAYLKIIDILNNAFKEVVIIDSYADKNVLDMILKLSVKVFLITKNSGILKSIDIDKYNKMLK